MPPPQLRLWVNGARRFSCGYLSPAPFRDCGRPAQDFAPCGVAHEQCNERDSGPKREIPIDISQLRLWRVRTMHRIRAKVALLAWFPRIHTQKFFAHGLFDTCLQTQLDPT